MQPVSDLSAAELLAHGIAALKAGQQQRASNLLTRATERDPQDSTAWLWLSGAVATDDERRSCLERVIAIEPQNMAAQRGLAQLPPAPPAAAAPVVAEPPKPDPFAFPELPNLLNPQPALSLPVPAPVVAPVSVAAIDQPVIDQTPLSLPPASQVALPMQLKARPNRLMMWLLIGFGSVGMLCAGCVVLVGVLSVLGKRVETPIQAIAPAPTGWQQLSGSGASLWVPSSYVGGDVLANRPAVVQQVETQGTRFRWMVEHVQNLESDAVLWAFDPSSQSSGVTTNMQIGSEYVPSGITIDKYFDGGLQQMGDGYRLVSREVVPRGTGEMGRMVVEASDYGGEVRLVTYVVKQGTRCWYGIFVTGVDEYDRNLAVFEQSMRTFAVQQPK